MGRFKKFILPISLTMNLILVFSLYSIYEDKKFNRNSADDIFIGSLSRAADDFQQDYSNMKEEDRVHNYIEISYNLYTAANILDFTSYAHIKNRNYLFAAIADLHTCIILNESREAFLTNRDKTMSIYKALIKIKANPGDEQDCKVINDITTNMLTNPIK
ncbi:hypothetical protein IAI10_12680 [Clostridium sp. 19966]|uniref:hypothetical protein n=1 Tax=Clostridium sp. 19966 TaxID=2768166 RepID=UPI0028DFEBA3|nr:hypothetical protein [Clostridium sp. 19966]MDT8717519.1 hypothetical protein [Clostridium sp. 19966]